MSVPAKTVSQFFRDLAKRQKEEGEARVQMYQEVGRAIMTLSEVEQILAEIFVVLSAPQSEKKSAKIFYEARDIPAKIDLVNGAVLHSPFISKKEHWNALSARVSAHRLVRNIEPVPEFCTGR